MPFNFLLWKCLIPGETSLKESGRSARIKPRSGECVLAFSIDNEDFRARFKVRKVCDALFFYKSRQGDPILLFVELKGSDIASAAPQLGQALKAIQNALARRARYRAVVVTRGGAPARDDPLRRQFYRKYGVELSICRDGDLRPHL